MGTIPLQGGIIYGPVPSRRLGVSLGVNLSPTKVKVCSMNCAYCQYGPTKVLTQHPDRSLLPTPDEVEKALEKALRDLDREPDYITFSGNGEPTTHPDFPEIARRVRELRDRLGLRSRIALLTNGTGLLLPGVLEAILENVELPAVKLDAGNPEFYLRVNRPARGVCYSDFLAKTVELRDRGAEVVIQAAFFTGRIDNTVPENVKGWLERLKAINPVEVHVYTIDSPVNGLEPAPEKVLREIASQAEALGFETLVFPNPREKLPRRWWS